MENMPFDLYNEFYYATICHVCKIKNNNLKSCKGCNAYRYCSVKHQKHHWPSHKSLCKIISDFKKKESLNNCFENGNADWLQCRLRVKMVLENGLFRQLLPSEHQLWMFPRVCAFCRSAAAAMLFDCQFCPAVSYCSTEHKNLHRELHMKICCQIQLQYKYYCSRLYEGADIPELDGPILSQLDFDNSTLFSVDSKLCDDELPTLKDKERLSHMFTIAYTLKLIAGADSSYVQKEELVFHIVGAVYEWKHFTWEICELLFHWFKKLTQIKLIFVGPEVDIPPNMPHTSFCNSCQQKNVQMEHLYKKCLYSECVRNNKNLSADFVAVFNCGFHEFHQSYDDTWQPSLPMLLKSNIPLLLTSYTYEESVKDLETLLDHANATNLVRIKNFEKNPYHGGLPLRDWTKPDEIYFNNYYLSILYPK